MKTFYEITLMRRFDGIKPVRVEKETPGTITIDGHRKNKISKYVCYYSNPADAKAELQNHFSKESSQAEYNIQKNKDRLKRFKKYLIELENYQT